MLENADIIGGILGVVSAFLLGLPLLRDIHDRKRYSRLLEILKRTSDTPGRDSAWRNVRDEFIDERLGNYLRYRTSTFVGFVFLLLAFIFILLASVGRINSHPH